MIILIYHFVKEFLILSWKRHLTSLFSPEKERLNKVRKLNLKFPCQTLVGSFSLKSNKTWMSSSLHSMVWKMQSRISQVEILMNAKSVMQSLTNFLRYCKQKNILNNKANKWNFNLRRINHTGNVSSVHILTFLTLKRNKFRKKMMLCIC